MRRIRETLIISLILASCVAHAADNMKAFPPAKPGEVRFVLQLPKEADETRLKVELMVGKTVKLDAVNKYFFGGTLEEETIKGWGFTRYLVRELGPMAGTRMGVDPAAPKVDRFISLGGGPYLIRYNSRLPVVVYVPAGTEVRYRIWRAGEELQVMKGG